MLSAADTSTSADLDLYRTQQRYQTLRTAIKAIGWVTGIWMMGYVIQPLAGQDTVVSLAISLLADLKFAVTIALAGAVAVWAIVERMLRYRKTEYLQNRIRKLERELDPSRSSSGLTPIGTTNPRDRRR